MQMECMTLPSMVMPPIFICRQINNLLGFNMPNKIINVKIDTKMHKDLSMVADKELSNISAAGKQAIDRHLID